MADVAGALARPFMGGAPNMVIDLIWRARKRAQLLISTERTAEALEYRNGQTILCY